MIGRRLLVVGAALIVVGCAGTPATSSPETVAQPSTSAPPATVKDVPESTAPDEEPTSDDVDEQRYPDIVAATAQKTGLETWRFDVTVSSPYDTVDRYADAWRVLAPDGTVLGVRELLHDHASEQPFTRSLDGVAIPSDVSTVTIEGRDQLHGWGGATVDVQLADGAS